MRVSWRVFFLAVPAACSSPSQGSPADAGNMPRSTSVVGTVAGKPVVSAETAGMVGQHDAAGSPYAGAIIGNQAGTCAFLSTGMTAPANTTLLEIRVSSFSGTSPPAPGTYPVGLNSNQTAFGFAEVAGNDPQCVQTISQTAQSGSITLDTVGSAAVSGSFDLTFPNGDHLRGQFYGPVCNVDLSKLGQNGSGTCAPMNDQ